MTFWINIHRLSSRAFYVEHEKVHDEERLRKESRIRPKPRRVIRRVIWPIRTTSLLLLIDIVIFGLLIYTLEPLITLLRRNNELFGPRVALPSSNILNYRNHTARSSQIPLILHQTTATEMIPDRWIGSHMSCKRAYSGFEYKLWTDASARDFLVNNYLWFVDTWDHYPFPIQRADSIRYFVLYHYGGIYLDMDTWCNDTIPIQDFGLSARRDFALFKSTLPTGVTNDLLATSARHPVYAAAITRLPMFNAITQAWARWQPHCAVMISAGPMFLTMVLKDYLIKQPLLPSPTVGVTNATELSRYITDLESSTWHRADTNVFIWIGERPWTWFCMGLIGFVAGISLFNRLLMFFWDIIHKCPSVELDFKVFKAA